MGIWHRPVPGSGNHRPQRIGFYFWKVDGEDCGMAASEIALGGEIGGAEQRTVSLGEPSGGWHIAGTVGLG